MLGRHDKNVAKFPPKKGGTTLLSPDVPKKYGMHRPPRPTLYLRACYYIMMEKSKKGGGLLLYDLEDGGMPASCLAQCEIAITFFRFFNFGLPPS